jgi:predicted helicase
MEFSHRRCLGEDRFPDRARGGTGKLLKVAVDTDTDIEGIPSQAWDYKLGNRSALEWVLDQYKESKPKDPTIREKFNTYRFGDYKDKVIELLQRVTTVSVETQRITEAMRKAPR